MKKKHECSFSVSNLFYRCVRAVKFPTSAQMVPWSPSEFQLIAITWFGEILQFTPCQPSDKETIFLEIFNETKLKKGLWPLLFVLCFVFLLQGFAWLLPAFVIEMGRLNDVLRAYIALHSGIVSGHWFRPNEAKRVKIMSHNWKWKLRRDFIFILQKKKVLSFERKTTEWIFWTLLTFVFLLLFGTLCQVNQKLPNFTIYWSKFIQQ